MSSKTLTGASDRSMDPSTGKRTSKKTTSPTRSEPRKHLWVDIGIKVMVPETTPASEHQDITAEVTSILRRVVQKALDDYLATKKNSPASFGKLDEI